MSFNADTLQTRETRSPYVEFEERAAAIYLNLARRFRDNAELSWFWLEMSMSERQHAVVLAFCEGQHLLNESSTANPVNTEALSEFFRDLETRVAQPGLSLDDAFKIATELETSEINEIYDRLVRPTQGTSYFIRKKVEALGVNHPRTLAAAARRFGVSLPDKSSEALLNTALHK